MLKVLADRLMDSCLNKALDVANDWYKELSSNSRTSMYCTLMPKEVSLKHAISIYKNLGNMYFAENCFQEVSKILDLDGFVEEHYARNVPLHEVIYALILLRRQIWLYATQQALYDISDAYYLAESINRILLVFDYITYQIANKYAMIEEIKRKK